MRRILAALLCAAVSGAALPQDDKPHPSAPAAAKMRESVERLIAALPEKARAQAMRPFEDRDRLDWHYTPRSRGRAQAGSRRSASAGRARARAASRTTTACRGRFSSSNTMRRRTTATTSTPCGATSREISGAIC
jgi:hypothetical protein